MNDPFVRLILGVWIGGIGMMIAMEVPSNSWLNQMRVELSKIEKCQEALPRNVKCVLVAIPENQSAK